MGKNWVERELSGEVVDTEKIRCDASLRIFAAAEAGTSVTVRKVAFNKANNMAAIVVFGHPDNLKKFRKRISGVIRIQ